MRASLLLALLLIVTTSIVLGHSAQASAQYRIQETPALNGLGMLLFKDIELRLDGGIGNTSSTSPLSGIGADQLGTQWYGGVFIDKPIVTHFLEMAYDCEFWQRDYIPRDWWVRDMFLEPIRLIAFYRAGEFRVAGETRSSEFYVGGRFSLDLGRIARHIRVLQK